MRVPPDAPVPDGADDLAGHRTALTRFVGRAGRWLALLLAVALVVPFGRWIADELAFRRSGGAVVEALGDDESLAASLLLVRVTTCAGTASTGSAFAVDLGEGPVVVTNRHVVEDAASVGVRPLTGGAAVAVDEVRVSEHADVAVLVLGAGGPDPVPLAAAAGAEPGQEVRIVGFPLARPFTTTGTVAAVDGRRLLLELPAEPGASGSPVLDPDGRVVGQVYARTPDGRGLATPVGLLAEAARTARPSPGC